MASDDAARAQRAKFIDDVAKVAGDRTAQAELAKTIAEKGGREDRRVVALCAARVRLAAQLAKTPDHPKAPGWRKRLAEYDTSLRNIAEHGREALATDNPVGVDIAVPVGRAQGNPLPPKAGVG